MTRYLFGFICVLALGVMGCSEMAGTGECQGAPDGTSCSRGECLDGVCAPVGAFHCTEQGIRDAIADGDGPHFFACDGPTTIETDDTIVIDNDVILDGEGNLTVDGQLGHRVFDVNIDVTAELRGIGVTRGWSHDGGGIHSFGMLTVTDSTVSGNETPSRGGGIYAPGGTLTLRNSIVSGNAASKGGGIYHAGTLLLMTVTNSIVSDNMASEEGGGIYNAGRLTLSNSTVSGNMAPSDAFTVSSSGGGIYNDTNGRLIVTNSTVSDNTADFRGGGIFHSGKQMTLKDSTVSGNETDGRGGGIYSDGSGPLTLTNSTVSGNSAETGSAIVQRGGPGSLTLTNSTISGSVHAESVPGDPDRDPPIPPTPVHILTTATQIDGACTEEGDEVTWTSNGYNVESLGDTCGFDQLTDQVNVTEGQLDLGPLADNGGPTMTHALGAGSVAIDHIPAEDCVDADGAPLTTDQRGEARPGGTMCDVGAFEVQP